MFLKIDWYLISSSLIRYWISISTVSFKESFLVFKLWSKYFSIPDTPLLSSSIWPIIWLNKFLCGYILVICFSKLIDLSPKRRSLFISSCVSFFSRRKYFFFFIFCLIKLKFLWGKINFKLIKSFFWFIIELGLIPTVWVLIVFAIKFPLISTISDLKFWFALIIFFF